MVYFQTKNPILDKYFRALKWNVIAVWNILWPFGYIAVFWYIFPRFGIL
jgi:hypothetical protein